MTTLYTVRSRIATLTNGHIANADIDALINRVHQEEVESREWHYRQKRTTFVSDALKNAGTISVANGATKVFGTGTSFSSSDVGKYFRAGTTLNVIPVEVTQVFLYPDAIDFTEYTVTSSAVTTVGSAFGGVQATQAEFTVLGGNIRYTIDGTTPTPSVGMQAVIGASFTITGHTNLDNFQMIAEAADATVSVTSSRTTQELSIATAWPYATVTDGTYELFQRYYPMPADVDEIKSINHAGYELWERTTYELDIQDADRNERSDNARYWAKSGVNSTGRKLVELWPITTTSEYYQVDYLAGHTPLVNDSDQLLVPSAIMENKTGFDACLTVYAKTGDQRWMTLAGGFQSRYADARERLIIRDTRRSGIVRQVLDLDAAGYSDRYISYDYMVRHDG